MSAPIRSNSEAANDLRASLWKLWPTRHRGPEPRRRERARDIRVMINAIRWCDAATNQAGPWAAGDWITEKRRRLCSTCGRQRWSYGATPACRRVDHDDEGR